MGGLLIGLLVKDGPFRQRSSAINLKAAFRVFRIASFRKPAFGYFGHMWELYALWAFIPVALTAYVHSDFNISFWSFIIIGAGGFGCVQNGYLSMRIGARKAAIIALGISGLCCVLSPILMKQASLPLFLLFMIIWGITVVADSPMFSSLVAKEAPADLRGTGLTIVVCIGFAITIASIQLLNWMQSIIGTEYLFLMLAPGPVLGLISMMRKTKRG
jgi:predicted MFS family arabinose efflux permease